MGYNWQKKMKKLIIGLCTAIFMLGLASCGGNNQEEMVKSIPSTAVKITGDCSNYFTIDGDSVKIMLTKVEEREHGWEVRAVVPLAKTSEAKTWSELKALPHIEKSGWAGMMGFNGCYPRITYLDANGTDIDLDLTSGDGINEFLKDEGTTSENLSIKYYWEHERGKYEDCKAKFDKVSGIKLVIDLSFEEQFADEKPGMSETSSISDWDAVLDEYEKYVNTYVSLYKKAMNGDMSAMEEYASMLEKAENFSSKLENASGDLTASQIARMNRINQKMLNSMQ